MSLRSDPKTTANVKTDVKSKTTTATTTPINKNPIVDPNTGQLIQWKDNSSIGSLLRSSYEEQWGRPLSYYVPASDINDKNELPNSIVKNEQNIDPLTDRFRLRNGEINWSAIGDLTIPGRYHYQNDVIVPLFRQSCNCGHRIQRLGEVYFAFHKQGFTTSESIHRLNRYYEWCQLRDAERFLRVWSVDKPTGAVPPFKVSDVVVQLRDCCVTRIMTNQCMSEVHNVYQQMDSYVSIMTPEQEEDAVRQAKQFMDDILRV